MESSLIKGLSQLLMVVCATIVFFTLRSSSKSETDLHGVLNNINKYLGPANNTALTHRSAMREKGAELIRNKYPSSEALLATVRQGLPSMDVSVDWGMGFEVYLPNRVESPKGFVSIPYLTQGQTDNLGVFLRVLEREGNSSAVVSIPDYVGLLKKINSRIKSTGQGYRECTAFINAPVIVPATQSRTHRNDTVEVIPLKCQLKFWRQDGGYVLMKPAALQTEVFDLDAKMLHFPIPNGSFADYMAVVNANDPVGALTYQQLVDEVATNKEGLEKHANESLLVAIPKTAATSEDFTVSGFSLSNDWAFVLLPALVLALLIVISVAVKAAVSEAHRETDPAVSRTKRLTIYLSLIPLPVQNTQTIKEITVLTYLALIPMASLLLPMLIRNEKFTAVLMAGYVLAMGLCFYLAKRIIDLLGTDVHQPVVHSS